MGRSIRLFRTELVASVSPLQIDRANKPRRHEVGGHDSATARAFRLPPCRFTAKQIEPAGCAAAIDTCRFDGTKED
jgi:hypothetical protein